MLITSYQHECPHVSLSIFSHTTRLLAPNNVSELVCIVFTFLSEADVPIDFQNFLTFLDIPNGVLHIKHE
jgi:hypothetical protein